MSQQRTRELLDKLLANECTPAEKQELFRLTEQLPDQPDLQSLLQEAWDRYDQPVHTLPEDRTTALLSAILEEGKVIPMRRRVMGWR